MNNIIRKDARRKIRRAAKNHPHPGNALIEEIPSTSLPGPIQGHGIPISGRWI